MYKNVLHFLLMLLILVAGTVSSFAQNKEKPTFGFQMKLIFPTYFLDGLQPVLKKNDYEFKITQNSGTSFGGFIRKSIYKRIYFESGISMSTRKYSVSIDSQGNNLAKQDFKFISYEIPLNGLIFIQLTDNSFLNNSFGFSLDFQPSDLFVNNQNRIQSYTRKKFFILPALNVGTGYELRLKKYGSFYGGFSYHRMLTPLAYTNVQYKPKEVNAFTIHTLKGNYFSIDLRYIFPTSLERKTDED